MASMTLAAINASCVALSVQLEESFLLLKMFFGICKATMQPINTMTRAVTVKLWFKMRLCHSLTPISKGEEIDIICVPPDTTNCCR